MGEEKKRAVYHHSRRLPAAVPADARQDAGRAVGEKRRRTAPNRSRPCRGQQEPQLSLVMTMSESDLANFLLQYLPFTPRGLCGKHRGGRNRVDVHECRQGGAGGERSAHRPFPRRGTAAAERCSLAGKWGVRAEQGRLQFTCLSAQLNDADLPQTAAEFVTDAMANALNRKLEELNVAPQRLAWSDGEIEIYA